MSAAATGWVWKHSPYTGGTLLVTLAIADVVNDVYENKFWMSTAKLAKKARVSRSTVTTALATLTGDGVLEVVKSGQGRREPTVYRWLDGEDATSATTALATPPTRPATALDTRDQRASTSATSARNTQENSKELNNNAGATAPAPLLEGSEGPAREPEPEDPRARSREIARAFYDRVKETTGHPPPENYMAVAKVVEAALRGGFTVAQVKNGMWRLHQERRPITRQTLWKSAEGIRDAPRRTPTDVALSANDWVDDVAAIHAEKRQAEETA